MSDNVVIFKLPQKPEAQVWKCNCGSFTFWLYSDQTIVCSECEQEGHEMAGVWKMPWRENEG